MNNKTPEEILDRIQNGAKIIGVIDSYEQSVVLNNIIGGRKIQIGETPQMTVMLKIFATGPMDIDEFIKAIKESIPFQIMDRY